MAMKNKTLLYGALCGACAFLLFVQTCHIQNIRPVHGTGAIAIWTPDKIVLAVDSKVRHLDGTQESSHNICKIITVGGFSLAMSGLYDNPATGYDAWELARASLGISKTIPDAASQVEKAIRPKLEAALSATKKNNPAVFEKELSDSYLAFFVAGVDSGDLRMAGRNFVRGRDSLVEVLAKEYPGTNPVTPDAIGFSVFGEHKAIDSHYSDDAMARLLGSQDITKSATQLLQLEIDEEAATVGPPRAILEINKLGEKWIESGLCK
jgi:hypothetical protein